MILRTKFTAILVVFFFAQFVIAQNPILTENVLAGNPSSEWELDAPDQGDTDIQGFADGLSINTGETIEFKIDVKAPATNYSIKIFRLGYYGGDGARLIADLGNGFVGTAQPIPDYEVATGKTDCSNWSVSASWTATGAVSGIYLALLERNDDGGRSHIAFVVRDDSGAADMIFKTSDATWQAYNGYGGASLYVNNTGNAIPPSNRATKVSYNRPFFSRGGGGGSTSSEDWLFNAEYPMIRWLERNGYNISYTTDLDMDLDPNQLQDGSNALKYDAFLSVGHDEYWSLAQRNQVEAARDAGMHLAFFSGNEVYWKTRWEDNNRTLVCYKEGTLGESQNCGDCDPDPNEWTGLWRGGCGSTDSNDGCNPENSLTGQISWGDATGSMDIPEEFKDHRFWQNTSVASLTPGNSVTLPNGVLGYEFDFEQPAYAFANPSGRVLLSNTILAGKLHKMSLYRHPSGALVFGAGTVQWSWGLDSNHDRGNEPPSADMQQATVNLFAEMGVQPGSLQGDLTAASASADVTGATTIITTPVSAEIIPVTSPYLISGTASDGEGTVAGVEVSVDSGTTWEVASGTDTWTYTWIPQIEDDYTILARSFDDLGNIGANASVSVTVGPPAPPSCTCTIWPSFTVPTNVTEPDPASVELGVRFQSIVAGYITGIRFYKGPSNLGTHRGSLWSDNGTLLATVTFTNESAEGWQEALFSNPVPIDANTTYVASYYAPQGNYSADVGYFATEGFVSNPLRALADGEDGANGVYNYSSESPFPTETFQSSNYYVDVVFETEVGPDETAPTVQLLSPADASSGISINTVPSVTFSESMYEATLTGALTMTGVSGTLAYNAMNKTLSFIPDAPLVYNTNYSLSLLGSVADLAGNTLGTGVAWSFTTSSPPPPPPTDGPGGPILVISSTTNDFNRYTTEILRAQGFNEFTAEDESAVDANVLGDYQVVILGDFAPSAQLVTDLTTWVNDGGTLIAFRPNAQLHSILGITAPGGNIAEGYILVSDATSEGVGIVNETIQYHGTADQYSLDGATSLATLYSNAATATGFAAITRNDVGANGGKAYAFAYDLARSIVFTRQGNPEWEGQNRDVNAAGSDGVIRSNDLFYGDAPGDPQPDWVNLDKVEIPQADEQMHLLSNMIVLGNLHNAPLPRFWMLPNNAKAAVVMTGDDHAGSLTDDFFNDFIAISPQGCSVSDWECIRGSSYLYPSTPQTDGDMLAFQNQGFEVGIHINTGCDVWTPASINASYASDLAAFATNFPSINAPTTHRTHCIAWSDYDTQPQVMLENGMRLDANYYYWPESWIQDRPGLFTGTAMPMRFATAEGELIDVYQVTTQFTDESGQTYPTHYSTLIDNAIGAEGYYGVFCANFHTDRQTSRALATGLATYAQNNGVPVVSSDQMLTWLDGRNASALENISWNGTTLNFEVSVGSGANNLYGMIPANSDIGPLLSMTFGGNSLNYELETIKGIEYAMFPAGAGSYEASFGLDETAPVISNLAASPDPNGTAATITWDTDEAANSVVTFSTSSDLSNSIQVSDPALTTSHSVLLEGLTEGTTYFYRVSSTDGSSNTVEFPVSPSTATFATASAPEPPCANDDLLADFTQGLPGSNTLAIEQGNGAVILNPTVYESFDATELPAAGWADGAWTAGGTIQYPGGSTIIDGSRVYTTTSFSPGSVLEFEATFTAGNFQNIGFTLDDQFNSPWVVIGRGDLGDNNLYARSSLGETVLLGTDLLNAPHQYRILWNEGTNDFSFFVDGTLIPTPGITLTVPGNMIALASDFPVGGVSLTLNWLKAGANPLLGVFESRIFDAGIPKLWTDLTWEEDLPVGTTISLAARVGSVLPLVGPFTPLANSGDLVNQTARYIQYEATLNSGSTSVTPALNSVTISCEDAGQTEPVVTVNPQAVEVCDGEEASFTAAATGNPIPTVQWQVSTNGGVSFTDISGAVSTELNLIATSGLDGTQYRAVFSNGIGSFINSDAAVLTVTPLVSGILSAEDENICLGESGQLIFTANPGSTGPYDLEINGQTYADILSATPFTPIVSGEIPKNIWSIVPTPQSVFDGGNPVVLGVKFTSAQEGYISGIRFFKSWIDGGSEDFTATLYSNGDLVTPGAALATGQATYTDSDLGWLTIPFSAPVFIEANATYIASYRTPTSRYSATGAYFGTAYNEASSPLTAISAADPDGPNGVFVYDNQAGFPFPSYTFNSANYWVDVNFLESLPSPGTETFTLTNITPTAGCLASGADLGAATITTNPFPDGTLSSATGTVCVDGDAEVIFNATEGTGPFDLEINGTVYSGIQDGVPFQATPAGSALPPTSIWTTTPNFLNYNDQNAPIETGVKFQSTQSGQITSVRFYKVTANPITAGALVRIWTNGGTELASSSFTVGSETGWQVIDLPSPVNIQANTTYVASVYFPDGDYVAEGAGSLINEVVNPPLKALSDAEAGGNGVFNFGSAGFPTTTAGSNNYGVDIVFTSTSADFLLSSITDANCTVSGSPLQSLSLDVEFSPEISSVTPVNPTSCSPDDGSIDISATGDGTLEYSIDNGASWQSTGLFENLGSGSYNILVRLTENGCEAAWSGNPIELNAPLQPFSLSYAGSGTGLVTVNPDQTDFDCGASAELTAVADPGSEFTGWSGDLTGNNLSETITISGPTNITAIFDAAPSFESDDFDRANLDLSRWTFENPLGDGWLAMTGQNTSDAYLELNVPEGQSHDPFDQNRSVRAMQDVLDEDFEIEVKFDSEPDLNQAFQLQGIIIEQDDDNWIRFDLSSDGTNLRLYSGVTTGGSTSGSISGTIVSGEASHMRVGRTGNDWIMEYSGDGSTWTQASSFNHAMVVNQIGPFAANHVTGGGNAPAFTAQVDYIDHTSNPVVDDNGAEPDIWEPFIHTISSLGAANELTITWYTDEPSVGAIDFGPTTAYGTTETESTPTYFHSLTVSGLVPGNTYNYRLRSTDGLSQEAETENFTILFEPEGPIIDVWYGDTEDFGTLGNPQETFINIFGNVNDPDGVSVLTYTLDGGSAINLSIGPDARRLENPGDFNIDPDWTTLADGPHTIEITATDGVGNISTKTVTVNYTGGNVWPLPYTADWSTLTTDGDPLTPDPEIQTLSQVVDGKWSVDNGEIRTVEPGYDRLVAIGDYLWDDYRVKVPVTVHSTSGGFGAGVLFRWNGHTDTPVSCVQPECGYEPLGAIGWFRNNSLEFYQGVSESFSFTEGVPYWFLMEVESTAGGPTYRLKVWEVGQTEPVDWNLEQQEAPGTPVAGSLLLIAHESDVSFGTVEVTPVITPNDPPVAVDDNSSVQIGTSIPINVLNNDNDPDGLLNNASVTIVTPPSSGTITNINPANGQVTYLHDGSTTTSDSFTYTVEDNDGAASNVATVNITITPEPVLAFFSDDFCAPAINTDIWAINELGSGTISLTGSETNDAWLQIDVPAGVEHQMFNSIYAPHLLQSMIDTDFEVEVKFESTVVAPQYQEQGILVKQDENNFLRLEFFSSNSQTTLYAASYGVGGTVHVQQNIGTPGLTPPLYMRVKRETNDWTISYSFDGSFADGADYTFSHVIAASGIGPYAGNASGSGSPAHTVLIDYFENLDDPILDEDGCGPDCAITNVETGPLSACDGVAGTFSQEVIVTYEGAPATGTLDVNGQSFAIGTSPQTIVLTELSADGLAVDVSASFSDNPSCTLTEVSLFTAPELPVLSNVVGTNPTNCGLTDGEISITAFLTVGTLEYSIDNGANWQSASTFTGLSAGSYTVLVRNQESSCEVAWTSNPVILSDLYDSDGDGVTCDTDCNDADPLEFPGQIWYLDGDGDGYGIGISQTSCLRPLNHFAATELIAIDGDCNDADPIVYPGQPCDDGDPCTENDICDGNGNCAGTPIVCDDGNPNTIDTCDGNGNCVFTPIGTDLSGTANLLLVCGERNMRVRVFELDGTNTPTVQVGADVITTIDANGDYTLSMEEVPPGTYGIYFKVETYLQQLHIVDLDSGTGTKDLTNLRGGDIAYSDPENSNPFFDNTINGLDLSLMLGYYNTAVNTEDEASKRSDLNCDGLVDALDLSLLIFSFFLTGDGGVGS